MFNSQIQNIVFDSFTSCFRKSVCDAKDIGLIVSSKSIEKNCELLQKLTENLLLKQGQNCMQFDTDKIDLIHFHSKRRLDLENEKYSVKIEETVFQPKESVKYIGIWLDSKLSFR